MKFKKISIAIFASLTFMSQAYAATPGVYVGVGAGYSSLNNFTDTSKQGGGGLGGQLVAGYNINPYFGVELGYRAFNNTTFNLDYYAANMDYSLHSLSLVGKLYLPLFKESKFDYYTLIGISESYGKARVKSYYGDGAPTLNNNALLGTLGVGFSYKINAHITTSLEYSYTTGKDGDGDDKLIGIPAANLATLNIFYNF